MRATKVLSTFIGAAVVALLVSAPARAQGWGIERWEEHFPEASHELREWVRSHPEAAHRFFDWDGEHPERTREFVEWATDHRGAPLEEFIFRHPRGKWAEFDWLVEHQRGATEGFIAWTRRFPEAARSIVNHPHGLQWVGEHSYRAFWR